MPEQPQPEGGLQGNMDKPLESTFGLDDDPTVPGPTAEQVDTIEKAIRAGASWAQSHGQSTDIYEEGLWELEALRQRLAAAENELSAQERIATAWRERAEAAERERNVTERRLFTVNDLRIAAEAEVARLREALEWIAYSGELVAVRAHARAALSPNEEEK